MTPWTQDQACAWYARQPWLLGCNFVPSTAVNQLEMFQNADYDQHRDVLVRELGWARDLGMNTLRVFLHDLLWESDREGFIARLDDFLGLCAARDIKPTLVFFDSCHRPEPRPGPQPLPEPGRHNPGWAQSPAVSTLTEPSSWGRLEGYVKGVLERFGGDDRILCWDLYNEPCNAGFDNNRAKAPFCERLVESVFTWARAARPSQPLTVCAWNEPRPFGPSDPAAFDAYETVLHRTQRRAVELSDIISFHAYGPAAVLETWINELAPLGRPLLCTEYMARTTGGTFANNLPVLKRHCVAAYNWGFVAGKTQTIYPWFAPGDTAEPSPWFHDILRADGTPYNPEEARCLSGHIG